MEPTFRLALVKSESALIRGDSKPPRLLKALCMVCVVEGTCCYCCYCCVFLLFCYCCCCSLSEEDEDEKEELELMTGSTRTGAVPAASRPYNAVAVAEEMSTVLWRGSGAICYWLGLLGLLGLWLAPLLRFRGMLRRGCIEALALTLMFARSGESMRYCCRERKRSCVKRCALER